jgi:hypothetical protein
MEPLNDQELNQLLREWKGPDAPATLLDGVRRGGPSSGAEGWAKAAGPPSPWWRWLFVGTIRVPVPVAIAVALLFAAWAYTRPQRPAPLSEPTVSLADFEPVRQLELVVIGESK